MHCGLAETQALYHFFQGDRISKAYAMLHHFINPLHQFAGIYWACRIRSAVYGNSIYSITLAIIAARGYRTFGSRGQRGAAKILWGSPAEQTKEEMLAVKVK